MEKEYQCPNCKGDCWRDSVDVEVGIIYGPWGCPECGWSEDSELDRNNPNNKFVEDGRYTDQFGNSYSVDRLVENAERFGLGDACKKAFKE